MQKCIWTLETLLKMKCVAVIVLDNNVSNQIAVLNYLAQRSSMTKWVYNDKILHLGKHTKSMLTFGHLTSAYKAI